MIITVTAKAIAHDGKTVCFNIENEKQVLFVPGLVPGEQAKIEQDTLEIIEITKTSPDRTSPPCPYFSNCGGCDFQFMNIKAERKHKLDLIKHTLKNYFHLDFQRYIDCSQDLPEYNYRNRVNFQRQNKKIGFFSKRSNSLVEIDSCMLAKPEINEELSKQDYFQDLPEEITQVIIESRRGKIHTAQKKIKGKLKSQDSHPTGSFSQVNNAGNKKLIEILLQQKWGKQLTEFYAGSGNFTFQLKKQVRSIVAVESDSRLVKLAKHRVFSNKIHQLKFIKSTTEKYIKTADIHGSVLLDPPRSGAKELAAKLTPKKNPLVVYVSCNPSTLGRDLQILEKKGYQMEELYFIDMFSRTRHVECLAVLTAS